jgi:hypothetical protein
LELKHFSKRIKLKIIVITIVKITNILIEISFFFWATLKWEFFFFNFENNSSYSKFRLK